MLLICLIIYRLSLVPYEFQEMAMMRALYKLQLTLSLFYFSGKVVLTFTLMYGVLKKKKKTNALGKKP